MDNAVNTWPAVPKCLFYLWGSQYIMVAFRNLGDSNLQAKAFGTMKSYFPW